MKKNKFDERCKTITQNKMPEQSKQHCNNSRKNTTFHISDLLSGVNIKNDVFSIRLYESQSLKFTPNTTFWPELALPILDC